MIAQELEITLQMAYFAAKKRRHEYISVEHLLMALLTNPSAKKVLKTYNADVATARLRLEAFLNEHIPRIPLDSNDVDAQPTLGFQRVVQRAIFQVQASGRREVIGVNVLLSILSEKESHAVAILKAMKINRQMITDFIEKNSQFSPTRSTGFSNSFEGEDYQENEKPSDSNESNNEYTSSNKKLETFAVNLNQKAISGKIDPLIGREEEIERMIQILCRRRKNNPLLVGESGVGKTAIVEGLALKIVSKEVPEMLQPCKIYSLDIGDLISGTRYRGDFEQRIKNVIKMLNEEPDAILFIDEIHTLVGAGSSSSNSVDASNLFKPALANGSIRCIGATTYKEFRSIFEKDSALNRRFQRIDVEEPSVTQTIEILKGLKSLLENHHNIKYSASALTAAAELSSLHLQGKFLPDKAIDVIDEAGAAQRILPKNKQKKIISKHEIENVIAKIARIPPKTVSQDDKASLRNLERDLQACIFGQDEAIESISTSIKLNYSGLGDSSKPIGSFLFSGATGVGKTELAKQLAFILGVQLIRFDMSEYMEAHSVARLIGSPPGYVGFEQGGLLTEKINQNPHSVLLLDEIEKAHPNIFNVLLQVMDYGSLTDSNGRKSDFRNVILIMTTNAGAKTSSRNPLGFHANNNQGNDMEDIKRHFSPEFRNRLDTIVLFKSLDESVILKIVDKFLMQLEEKLLVKNIEIEFDEDVRLYLARKGFDDQMGARPMSRLIQNEIKKPLADALLFGDLPQGSLVKLSIEESKIHFNYESTKGKSIKKLPESSPSALC